VTPLLAATGIVKRFAGLTALGGVDLTVQAAQVFGVIGPNGAGKTTLFNIISGLETPQAGTLHLDGDDITGLPFAAVARRGLVRTFQRSLPFEPMTLRDNVLVASFAAPARLRDLPHRWLGIGRGQPELRDRAEALLERVGLAGRAAQLAAELSHGDRRRLEIARALMCEPCLLLLDEPAAGLSIDETQHLVALLANLRAEGQTVIIIEHNLGLMMSVCDRIAVLDHGIKIAEGTPDEVRRDEQVIAAYLGRSRTADA